MLKILAAAIVVFVSAGCDTTGARRAPETATARSPVPEPSQAGGPRLETSEADLGGGVKLELVKISAGEFQMGSPSGETDRYDYEGPVHTVRIDKPFWLGKYEVTQAEWEAVMGSNPSNFKGARNPVEQVSWNDCQEFLGKLNARVPGGGFRLPTEAEWEYACRAGTRTRFSHGDDPGYGSLGQYGWFDKNSGNKTHPVGGLKANPWGLFDMHGNVWEWCSSLSEAYPYASGDGRDNLNDSGARVLRGGSWDVVASLCRSARRDGDDPGSRLNGIGFRVARTTP